MRKLLLLLLIAPTFCFAQLSEQSQSKKANKPQLYSIIKDFALAKWGDDYNMASYEINQQVGAQDYIISLLTNHFTNPHDNLDFTLLLKSVFKWEKSEDAKQNIAITEKLTDDLKALTGAVKYEKDPKIKESMAFFKKVQIKEVLDTFAKFKTDWTMVKYEYDNQLKAKQSL